MAELLRQRIEQYDFDVPSPVTASFGVAAYRPGTTADTLVKWADDALYEAKAASKNCLSSLIALTCVRGLGSGTYRPPFIDETGYAVCPWNPFTPQF